MNQQAIDNAWAAVRAAGMAMRSPATGAYTWGKADDDMESAGPADLFAWVDDVADRLQFDETNFRAAVMDYLLLRDGAPQGMTATDHAAALLDLFERSTCEEIRGECYDMAENERDIWGAICARTGDPADEMAHNTWENAMGDMENNLS